MVMGHPGLALADPPPPGIPEAPAPTGNFLSTLKQAIQQNLDNDVVRGHFDVGTPPDSHRYYCLVDAKTAKREEYGVAGELTTRRDGMRALTNAAVSFYSCAKAEAQGILVTTGYVLDASAAATPTAAASPTVAAAPPPPAVTPGGTATRAPDSTGGLARTPGDASIDAEVRAVFAQFVTAYNAHDRPALAAVLWDSKDFVLTRTGAPAIWGTPQALDSYATDAANPITLTPPLDAGRIANPAPDVAILVAPLLSTTAGSDSAKVVTWQGVFVKTTAGWRIASIVER